MHDAIVKVAWQKLPWDYAGYTLDAKTITRRTSTERPTKPTMRTIRRRDAGVEDAAWNGMTRAPHDGHMEAVSWIGSTQRQHALVINTS